MSIPQIFKFDSKDVKTIERDGELWFVARDVAEILGYSNISQTVRDHCKCSIILKGIESIHLTTSPRGIIIIPERDVYRLIMRSTLPAAERFEDWIVGTVIPTIRRTGGYGVDPSVALNDPVTLQRLLLTQVQSVIALKESIAILEPIASGMVRISKSIGSENLNRSAKALRMLPQKEFNPWLESMGWIYRHKRTNDWTASQHAITKGWLEQPLEPFVNSKTGREGVTSQVFVTKKGIAHLSILMESTLKEAA